MKAKILFLVLVLAFSLAYIPRAYATVATVGTSTSATAVSNSQEQGCMYINGQYWAFYSDGTNFKCFSSSDNGATDAWAAATNWTTMAATSANRFDVCVNNVAPFKFAYAWTRSSNSYLYFGQGELESDGSVTWDSVGQQTVASNLTTPFYPSVDYDGSGKAWISVYCQSGTTYRIRVYHNTASDGTFTVASGFPLVIYAFATNSRSCILGFTQEAAVCIYAKTTPVLYSVNITSAGVLGTERTASDAAAVSITDWGATKNGNETMIVYHKVSTNDLYSDVRTANRDVWGTDKQINITGLSGAYAPVVSCDTATGNYYCFQEQISSATTYSYFKYSSGSWSMVGSVTSTFYDKATLQVSKQAYNSVICVIWLKSGNSPRNVAYDTISVAAAPTSWTWTFGTVSRVVATEKWTIQKTFKETSLSRTLESKRFLMHYSWRLDALCLSLSTMSYQRLIFQWKPRGLSWCVSSETIVRTLPFPQGYDSSSSLGGLGLLMHYQYVESGLSESLTSSQFIQSLVFRETGLSETLGSLSWTKIINFITYTESMSSETVGSERWLMEFLFKRGDSSFSVGGSAWFMHFRISESGISETLGSREFVKNLVFRETGLSETLGFLSWNKVLEFFVWTEATVSETVGSVSWAVSGVQSHLILVMAILIALCLLGCVVFLAYKRRTE